VLNTAAGVLSQPAGLGMQGKSICRTVQNLLHMGGFRKKKRDSPVKKKVLEKAGTVTDRAQIRQIQMRFPSEIKSFWSEQERKQEMQRRQGCCWEQKKSLAGSFGADRSAGGICCEHTALLSWAGLLAMNGDGNTAYIFAGCCICMRSWVAAACVRVDRRCSRCFAALLDGALRNRFTKQVQVAKLK